MKRNLDDLTHELECISTTLSALGYSIEGGVSAEFDLTKSSAQEIIFGCCNHLDRVVEDLNTIE